MNLKRPTVRSPTFSGHESFPLRYAWLKKGHDAIRSDPRVFNSEEAMVLLGVGKNMVRSIRHWGIATGMWAPKEEDRGRSLAMTDIGLMLLRDAQGWDPYMDEVGTIWLLHWLLCREPSSATSWWYLFSRPHLGNFTKVELEAELRKVADEAEGKRAVPSSTLHRDLDVLLRSYARPAGEKTAMEESLNSPLMLLNLVRPVPGQKGVYSAPLGTQPSLPQGIFEAALVDVCARAFKGGIRTLSLDGLLYGWGSPGRVFRLSEPALMDRLERAVQAHARWLSMGDTANLRQLLLHGDVPSVVFTLNQFYTSKAGSEAA